MDRRVSVRLFRVSEPANGVPALGDILLEIAQGGSPLERERDIGGGVTVRLETCAAEGEHVEGDLCRVQRVNIPPQAGADGLSPIVLAEGHGIGHMAAFLIHRPTRTLVLQGNPQSVTPNRLTQYVASEDPSRLFSLSPVLTDDALERFANGRARSFSVKFAGIDRLDALDDPNIPVARGARLIADAYDGLDVEIHVSVGKTRENWLSHGPLAETVRRLMGEPGINKLQAKLEGDERALDLLHEQLQDATELDLPEGNPGLHYRTRQRYLREVLRSKMPTIQRQFGALDGHVR